jgi:aminopeptidase-like protein
MLSETKAGRSKETDEKKVALNELIERVDSYEEGAECYAMIESLYPICRSITGDGVRQSLKLLQATVPLKIREVPTGTKVFDWIVPREWNIQDAYIKDEAGERVVDFKRNNLHVLNYSVPVRGIMSLAELRPHLFSLQETPDWIPYRTSYYKESWGFCLSHRQLQSMKEGNYEVCIDSTLESGSLTYGEFFIPGVSEEEILISCHICHPSLCNDNLSGVATAVRLAWLLCQARLRRSYRFLWVPGTIGSITWLALNEPTLSRIEGGLVLSCVGDRGSFTYKRSRRGNAVVDRAVEHLFFHSGQSYEIADFTPYGYDERQYCSPGLNLPVGCFMRTPNGKYPEYHTSADDLSLVSCSSLGQSLVQLLRVFQVLDENEFYRNLNPKCEPQLGRRGLYRQMGGMTGSAKIELAMLWVLSFSDGDHDLLGIAERSGLPFDEVCRAAAMLCNANLLSLC